MYTMRLIIIVLIFYIRFFTNSLAYDFYPLAKGYWWYYSFDASYYDTGRTNDYKSKYFSPENPPAWMTIEIASFGQLSMLFKNLRTCDARKATAKHFGVSEIVLESWLETLSFVRNTCAHHSRLWNRKLPKRPIIPDRAADKWLEILPETDKLNRIYIVLSIIRYMIKRINPGTTFPSRLKQLLSDYPEIPLHYMGFPNEWEGDKFWL